MFNHFGIQNNQNNTNKFETIQMARKDLIGEIQAIIDYDNHIHLSENTLAKQTWENIKNEELNHVGELLGLLMYLDPTQKIYVETGLKEFNDRLTNSNY